MPGNKYTDTYINKITETTEAKPENRKIDSNIHRTMGEVFHYSLFFKVLLL